LELTSSAMRSDVLAEPLIARKCSVKKPFSLTSEELDDHFGWPVQEAVDRLNDYYRQRLFAGGSVTYYSQPPKPGAANPVMKNSNILLG
jgi:hypothetical protein